jgi:hypothetical protein
MRAGARQQVFGVFYRDYARDVAISSARPESLLGSRLPALAERLLVDADNFLGVVDRNENILQLYRDRDGLVVVELLRPGRDDHEQARLPLEQVLQRLAHLPPDFDGRLLAVAAED